jgi:arylsulfatase A-like enzyme
VPTFAEQAATPRSPRLSAGVAFVLLAVTCLGGACGGSEAEPGPPNLLVIVADTLRADRLGSYGGPPGLTPFLDELAARGVVFANTYAPSSWTNPSVASLFTSRNPSQHRVVTYESVLADAEATVAEELARAGFRSLGVAANFRLKQSFGYAQGFDSWVALMTDRPEPVPIGELKVRAGRVVHEALEWLDADASASTRAPLFLYLHFLEPHPPYLPPEPFRRRFSSAEDGALEELNDKVIRHLSLPEGALSEEEIRELASLYDGEVAALDAALRHLFQALEQRGFLERAIVVVTSDHGEEFGEHDGLLHGFTLYEESIRVPLLFVLPGDPGGRVVQRNVSLLDVGPTLLELAGLTAPESFEGRSLVPWLHAEVEGRGSEGVLSELIDDSPVNIRRHESALIRDAWKVTLDHRGAVEVFDLDRDPGETRSSAGEFPERTAQLRATLEEQRAELATRGNRHSLVRRLEPELLEALRALGYAVE